MSNPPKFRTSRSTAHPGVTLYTLPDPLEQVVGATPDIQTDIASGSSTAIMPEQPGFGSLRRTTRSVASTSHSGCTKPIKAELSDELDITSGDLSIGSITPSKRSRSKSRAGAIPTQSITPTTPKRPRLSSNPVTPCPETDIKPVLTPTPKRTPSKKPLPLAPLTKPHQAPERWEVQYKIIERMRGKIVAPVDTMGCERPDLPDLDLFIPPTPLSATIPPLETPPPLPPLPTTTPRLPSRTQRFHTLISLMLSSQTKDAITAGAINNLHSTLPGGLTCLSLADASREVVEGCICKVGFWRRKAEYIQLAARQLLDHDLDRKEDGESGGEEEMRIWEKGDIPKTIEGLCKLKGVGPKMAFLALQCAWNINAGIGVDVHVHRITNRLKWHRPPTITAEQTRVNLESWLPKELHKGINPMLVGFGQVICLPVGPRCDICLLGKARICPSRISNVRTAGRKAVEYEFDMKDIEDIVPSVLHPMKEEVKAEVRVEELVKLEESGVMLDSVRGNGEGLTEVSIMVKVEEA